MGVVYAARNTLTGKQVAIKWVRPELAANEAMTTRVMREAQALARVRHPNVVDVYDVLAVDGSFCLVMELLEGEPLADVMERETVTLPELIGYILWAMRGVAAAHRQGIIHRDIKPENIFLAREGDDDRWVPKVLDFGISKMMDLSTSDARLTGTGVPLGTPLYMSMEQLNGERDIDQRTDVYAFGVVLYRAVTGRMPFEADSLPLLIAKMLNERAPAPKKVRPDIPALLSRLIERAIAKERAERVPSLDAFIRELEPFATDAGFREVKLGGSEMSVPKRRRVRVLLYVLTVLLAAAWWVFKTTPGPAITAIPDRATPPPDVAGTGLAGSAHASSQVARPEQPATNLKVATPQDSAPINLEALPTVDPRTRASARNRDSALDLRVQPETTAFAASPPTPVPATSALSTPTEGRANFDSTSAPALVEPEERSAPKDSVRFRAGKPRREDL